jgi:type IV pilus assembly protein PilV
MLNGRRHIHGFTLIEVLVTLVILMFGLLGIAGLMAKGQRMAFEAYQRQQALALANDMAERIRANRVQAVNYAAGATTTTPAGTGIQYTNLQTGSVVDCGTAACSGPNLASFDLAMWDGMLFGYTEQQVVGGAPVGGILNARGCVELVNTASVCPAPPAPPSSYSNQTFRVSVAWQGNEDTGAPPAGSPAALTTCGNGLYGSAGQRRVVSLDVLVAVVCP